MHAAQGEMFLLTLLFEFYFDFDFDFLHIHNIKMFQREWWVRSCTTTQISIIFLRPTISFISYCSSCYFSFSALRWLLTRDLRA